VACFEVLVAEDTYNAGEGAVVRQGHCMALVVAFLIGCAVVLMAGASGVRAEASQEEKPGRTEAAKEQGQSGVAASEGGDRCEGTREININLPARFTTNDLPGCPKGGPLLGTDRTDFLAGEDGDDEIRGLGGRDDLDMTRYVAAAVETISMEDPATTSSTVSRASYYPGAGMGSGPRSIAVKAGTHIGLTRKTTWTVAAR
jgi:hypothetical protein